MMPFRSLVAVVVMSLLSTVMLPAPAEAAPNYESFTGTVVRVNDGDTMDVNVDGDGQGAIRIRLIGVNAFELGECHADEAKTFLADLVEGAEVTLEGKVGQGPDRFGRMRRYVYLDGVDVGETLLSAGMVWPVPKGFSKFAKDVAYRELASQADLAGVGIWDRDACGHGPNQQNLDIELRLMRNPDGKDSDDPNKEWVKLVNNSGFAVDLSGWGVRGNGFERYTFPNGTTLGKNSWLKLHAGSGTDRAKHSYWGLDRPMFSNTHAETSVLIDDDGDIRSWKATPCWSACSDSLEGKVELRVNYDAPGGDGSNPNGEWVEVVNVSGGSINLVDRVLRNDKHALVIGGPGSLQPSERLRVYIGSGNDTASTRYWGKSGGILSNSGDDVYLESLDDVEITRIEWPCASCAASLPNIAITFVNPDAPGSDDSNLNQEFVVMVNRDSSSVSLADWALKSGGDWFRFASDVALDPGDELKLRTGSGTDDLTGAHMTIYWGLDEDAHANAEGRVKLYGPNLGVASCHGWGGTSCDPAPAPLPVKITVEPNPPGTDENNPNGEWVKVKNNAGSSLDLSDFWLTHRGHTYRLDNGTDLSPGETVTVYAGNGSNSRLQQYWGTGGGILSNSGGRVELIDTNGAVAGSVNY